MVLKLLRFKKKQLLWGGAILFALALAGLGTSIYLVTRPLDVEFAQEPNAVEEHEANRKLKLLNDAQLTQKRGYVRLSEVEINSFLEGRYNASREAQTNSPVKLVKSGVLLGENQATFVTWHRAPVFGLDLPIVWQRVVKPTYQTNGWTFALESMRVGDLDIPEQYWGYVSRVLGPGDTLFEERKNWLKSLPLVTLGHNDVSKSPEFRLYTYVPTEKASVPSER